VGKNNIRKTTEQFIKEAIDKHGDIYDYSEVCYQQAHSYVTIKCLIHGRFPQTPDSHLRGRGCPKCRGGVKGDKQFFIEKSNIVHNNFYDYSHVVYKSSTDEVDIKCPIHGLFRQRPDSHVQGNGCKICGIKKRTDKHRLSLEEFIKKSNIVHNNFYDYSHVVYNGAHKKITIKCPIHGLFEQMPADHLYNKCGCKYCGKLKTMKTCYDKYGKPFFHIVPKYNTNSISYIELISKKTRLKFNHAENGGEKTFTQYYVDAYNKKYNIIIEIDEKKTQTQQKKKRI
jgi:hypothetical protein